MLAVMLAVLVVLRIATMDVGPSLLLLDFDSNLYYHALPLLLVVMMFVLIVPHQLPLVQHDLIIFFSSIVAIDLHTYCHRDNHFNKSLQ